MQPVLRRTLDRLPRPIVVAHRGDSGRFPENTLPSFASAVALGADLVELDFHATRDGVLVCLHDDTLARTAADPRPIVEVGSTELVALDAGSWKDPVHAGTRVPTLESALEVIHPRSIAAIEHKAGDARTLVDLLARLELLDSVLVQSFDWAWLEAVHVIEPRIALAALGGEEPRLSVTDETLVELERTGAFAVNWHHERLRDRDPELLHARGYLVLCYTADRPEDQERLTRIGVDAITTNEPGGLLAVRGR